MYWAPTRSELESAPQWGNSEWIYTGKGLDLLDSRSFYWTPGKSGSRNLEVFNGPKEVRFRATYRKSVEGIEELKELHLDPAGGDKPFPSQDRPIMTAVYWAGQAEWLHEVLARGAWKLEKIEPILGERCIRLSAESGNGAAVLWLDLNHDCLPRRYQVVSNAISKIGTDFIVDEYLQLSSGIWFPKAARRQLQTTPVQNQLIVVSEVAINEPLDLARFDPPAPTLGTVLAGSRVNEFVVDGARTIPLEFSPSSSPQISTEFSLTGFAIEAETAGTVLIVLFVIVVVIAWRGWRTKK